MFDEVGGVEEGKVVRGFEEEVGGAAWVGS
jgi:hypothetical protein